MLGLVIACSHSSITSPIKVSPCIDGPIALGKLKAFAFGKEEGYETNRTKYLMLRGINVKLNVKYKTANYERKRHSIWKAYLTEGITLNRTKLYGIRLKIWGKYYQSALVLFPDPYDRYLCYKALNKIA